MPQDFEPLEPGEVISLNVYGEYYPDILHEEGMFNVTPTFRRSELDESIKETLIGFHEYYGDVRRKLLNRGLPCEVLRFGSKEWRKGKIRIRIEIDFCPDEPEILTDEPNGNSNQNLSSLDSSLDDIRQAIADHDQPG